MRQGQQNRRGRGRSNNNRKGQNPLTRSFESTGPDVKIRGTPAHIAEKYLTLARDASSSGDPVLAENYLQHAEHYNRIIMAFREQQMQQGGDVANGGMRQRPTSSFDPLDGGDEFGDEEGDDFGPEQGSAPYTEQPPQPRYEGQHRFEGRPPRERHEQHHRGHRDRYEPRGGEGRGGYGGGGQERTERPERGDRGPQPQQPPGEAGFEPGPGQARGEGQQRRRDRFVRPHEQPEFLRRPVRRPRREEAGPGDGEPEAAAPATTTEDTSRE